MPGHCCLYGCLVGEIFNCKHSALIHTAKVGNSLINWEMLILLFEAWQPIPIEACCSAP